jgi:hypothetical protein
MDLFRQCPSKKPVAHYPHSDPSSRTDIQTRTLTTHHPASPEGLARNFQSRGVCTASGVSRVRLSKCVEAADRARVKAHEKFYLDREAKIEQQRLAKIRERQEWEQKWLAWRFNGGPKPAPLDME